VSPVAQATTDAIPEKSNNNAGELIDENAPRRTRLNHLKRIRTVAYATLIYLSGCQALRGIHT